MRSTAKISGPLGGLWLTPFGQQERNSKSVFSKTCFNWSIMNSDRITAVTRDIEAQVNIRYMIS